jgi:H+/Cl- antiporter ClcA
MCAIALTARVHSGQLASTVGQLVRVPAGQRIIRVAAGAGAGIAATFNTPIDGVMFAIELMLPEVSVATFLPVAISTGAAHAWDGSSARRPLFLCRRWSP